MQTTEGYFIVSFGFLLISTNLIVLCLLFSCFSEFVARFVEFIARLLAVVARFVGFIARLQIVVARFVIFIARLD